MKTRIFAMLSFLVSVVPISMAGEADPVGLDTAIGKLQATLQAIPALTSVSSSTYSMTPAYYEINKATPAERPGHTVSQTTTLAGPLFKITSKSVSKNGDLYWDHDVAYDGRLFQKFDHVRDSLSIWKKTSVDLYDSSASPIDQFGFIAGFTSARSQAIKFEDLKSATLWAKILQKSKFLGYRKHGGDEVLSFEIREAIDPMGPVACRYEVDLSPEHGFFPVRWAAYTLKGELIQEFTVTTFAKATFNGIAYYFPTSALGKHVGIGGKFSGAILTTREWETSSLGIGPVDPMVFTIDPSSARAIVDQDTQTATALPNKLGAFRIRFGAETTTIHNQSNR